MPSRSLAVAACLLLPAIAASAVAQTAPTAQLHIAPGQIVTPVSPMLYGMMTEEINHAFDGGLYPELISNRTFRGSWDGVHWDVTRHGNAAATAELDKSNGPSKALTTSLKLTITQASPGNEAGLTNTGFWGIGVKPNTSYKGSLYARVENAGISAITAQLVSDRTGAVVATASIPVHTGDWSQYTYTLKTANAPAGSAYHFQLLTAQPGTIAIQLVSLLPPTYHDRPDGLRPDLMEKMAALHPNFLRLPGGNYLEGDELKDWYNFKETIGPMVDRPGHQAPWTYWSTDAMGLLEFLEWTEDLHIEPLLAVYAGYALHGAHITPGPDLEPYVQAALDEVEYVTGGPDTRWGAERAKDGHPAPFPLHYIEVGNEDWFDKSGSYDARFAQFAKALHARYPQYKLIATAPVKETAPAAQPDVLDDHYYKPSAEMLDFVHHYDDAPPHRPEDLRRRVGHALRHPHPQLRRRPGRCRLYDRHGAQLRPHSHGQLRAAADQRQPRRRPVVHQPDRLRRQHQLRVAQLLRAVTLRRPPRRRHREDLAYRRQPALLPVLDRQLEGSRPPPQARQRLQRRPAAGHRARGYERQQIRQHDHPPRRLLRGHQHHHRP